jgi:hypothetical protein
MSDPDRWIPGIEMLSIRPLIVQSVGAVLITEEISNNIVTLSIVTHETDLFFLHSSIRVPASRFARTKRIKAQQDQRKR